jgi:sialate O-acetylesterase
MIAPLVPYAIRGAVWYQGESNHNRAYQYRTLFPAMIRGWRDTWGQGEFPFYYVQIAPYNYGGNLGAAELREAQMMTLSVPNTGMAVTMDIGNPGNIHPRNKEDVGERLALWALAKTYGRKNITYSGPLYRKMKIEGNRIRLFFDHVDGGLVAQGGPLTHFTVAGEDQQFHQATATIDGKTILVHSDEVENPVAVRYGWSDKAEPNLSNQAGLPASSFRTDDWPGVTVENL